MFLPAVLFDTAEAMPGYPQGKSFDMGPIQWGEGGVAGPGAYIYNIYI